jgi:hypothetical protein
MTILNRHDKSKSNRLQVYNVCTDGKI